MRHLHDHVGKSIGHAALRACGATEIEAVLAPDARRADLCHEPDPERDSERARLGLLGRIASTACLIELYSGAPSDDDAVACLGKLIAFRQQRQREAGKRPRAQTALETQSPLSQRRAPALFASTWCWIIAARRPAAALSMFGATAAPGWPRGVFFGAGKLVGAEGVLSVGIIDASELPRERSTLLVRFMAAGPLLAGAIAEFAALEDDAMERTVAERILVDLEHALGAKPSPTPEEKELIMTMQVTWTDRRRLALAEGREVGRAEGKAHAVLTVLRVRGIPVPDAARERIETEADAATIERWLERAIVAASIAEVLDDAHAR